MKDKLYLQKQIIIDKIPYISDNESVLTYFKSNILYFCSFFFFYLFYDSDTLTKC